MCVVSRVTTKLRHASVKHIFAEVLPVIVSIAQGSDGDLEGLPYWVQGVLHHLCLMANGESVTSTNTSVIHIIKYCQKVK